MSKQVPWDAIPDSIGQVLPTDTYKFEIEDMAESESTTKKYMLKSTYRVVEGPHAGMVVFDNYCIGTDVDPQADDPKSWEGVAAARWKDILKKAAVPQKGTVEEACVAARGQQFVADVDQETETKEGPYKGKIRNRIKRTYRIGEKSAGTSGPATLQASAASAFRPGVKA